MFWSIRDWKFFYEKLRVDIILEQTRNVPEHTLDWELPLIGLPSV